ncbi:unnamed protein product [Acanthoscelides obtectus]|uniref:DNA repair endonuclease XPF n=3 Tax=Acanthoscelides obtectus TaxID=200917 RepID=A0A9P0K4C9_ACAOB|nr:unnamed protein product [Acanthoscelides obtectus]CAK1654220.1 DNA repair endonuclease XPF [Acanthoscelides obtectus]
MSESQCSQVEDVVTKTDYPPMTEFETQMFLDIVKSDGLIVAAKGLNLDLVILNILKVYCDPANLVLVLNATEKEEKYLMKKLNDVCVHSTTYLTNIKSREESYLWGGINFATTRIVVVDLLKKRLPIEKITGFVILRAHTILESCQEAFALRLYRQNNKTGFIKAFSNNAQSFTIGYGHVERVMRALFVKDLYLWPRFHSIVVQSLKNFEPNVIELNIPISEKMKKMQTHILDLMNLTVKELKRINKNIEMQEITVENCLTKKFHKLLQAQLDIIWHRLSRKSLQMVSDLKTLRHLLVTMFYSDPVTFYCTVMNCRSLEYAQTANWVLFQPAEHLFTEISSFIYNKDKEFCPDPCPKWEPLLELLKVEIPHQIKESKSSEHTILILCSDYRTCHQLKELLTNGPEYYLFYKALRNNLNISKVAKSFQYGKLPENIEEVIQSKKQKNQNKRLKTNSSVASNKSEEGSEEKETTEEDEEFQCSYVLTMNQTASQDQDDSVEESLNCTFEPFTQMEKMDLTHICQSVTEPKILIQTFKSTDDYIHLQDALNNLKPTFIIMYHCSMTAVREIEMYEAHRKRDPPLKVYFLLHGETVEEQSYLTTLRREKDAFEHLIQTKATMVIPEDQDGKNDYSLSLERDGQTPTKNTRAGGKDQAPKKQTIIVDLREFRSELPPLIHKRGIDIEPMTISIGDYILTPDICVERKSISDLIGSLKSGRLYQQCTQMSRYYSKPMLLIEFDQNKQFGWQNNYMLSTDSTSYDFQQKLLLLTLHFPKLKLIWSPSPYASAQLFQELKMGKEDPNIEYAATIGDQQDIDIIETKYNSAIYDFVQKLPGITSKNIDNFMRKCKSLDDVIRLDKEILTNILGNGSDAQAFYSALHEEHSSSKEDSETKLKGKGKVRFQYFKNKAQNQKK